jgi:putative FmdB family regulatory protein
MPIYELLCAACGTRFERITQGGQTAFDCPACSSSDVSRQVSAISVRGTTAQRRGRVIDLSSGHCPCHQSHPHTHTH